VIYAMKVSIVSLRDAPNLIIRVIIGFIIDRYIDTCSVSVGERRDEFIDTWMVVAAYFCPYTDAFDARSK